MRIYVACAAICIFAACKQSASRLDTATPPPGVHAATSSSADQSASAAGGAIDLDSKDILARPEAAKSVDVKHVLISWKDLADAFRGQQDPRAGKRTNAEAAALAREVADKLRANPASIDDLDKQYSEDPGSLRGEPYNVKDDSPFVPEFKNLALRLKTNEVGIVKSDFGYHIMVRVPPAPPDPLESAAILARPTKPGTTFVSHMLIGFANADTKDPRAPKRSKADADKLAQDILAKANGGADFAQLIKDNSDEYVFSKDPDARNKQQEPLEIADDTPIFDSFKNLALRLEVGEAGMIKAPIGWIILKRVPPPPPDPLESVDILKREPVTQKAKVKHVLLGWKDVHGEDPRGAKRDRATLEKLVHDTVAKLKGGAKIEPVMAELSEDPGSAKSGEAYDVAPDSKFVTPFKNLALRLNVKEVGVVRTEYGIHIIERLE